MPGRIYKRIRDWCKDGKYRSVMVLVVSVLAVGGSALLVSDFIKSQTSMTNGIARKSYGEGELEQELEVKTPGEKGTKMKVKVSERAYSEEEIKMLFQRCISKLDRTILGENTSLDHVEKDLNLVTSLPNEPVEISWESDRYDVVNVYGEIQKDMLSEEGVLVTLHAVITYTENIKKQARYECAAMIFPETVNDREKFIQKIKNALQKEDKKTQTGERFYLPREVEGKEVLYFPVMEQRGAVLLLMAGVIGGLIIALEKQEIEQEKEKRKAQMQLDYPEIISKLTLFLGAGMTIKRAWRKIAADYEKEKQQWGIHYAYEEMKQSCYEMDSGVTETESYERFGKRCGLREYMKLGALLSQNLRKGTRDLNQILKMEAVQSLEERKARARRLGEEAGTKLLVPMFLMLAEVLMIVIIPAFLSVRLGD